MKRILNTVLIVIATVLFGSCSHNNGGDTTFWGTWKLTSITIDGAEDGSYTGNYFWKFQGDVINIVEVDDYLHERFDHFGTWSYSASSAKLSLNFSHSDDNNPSGTGTYAPPSAIYLTDPYTTLTVEKASGDYLTLSHEDSEGTVKYYLERW